MTQVTYRKRPGTETPVERTERRLGNRLVSILDEATPEARAALAYQCARYLEMIEPSLPRARKSKDRSPK